MKRQRIMYTLAFALLLSLVIPIQPDARASGKVHRVTYEEYLAMGYKTDSDDCYERAHDGRRARPSGSLGGIVYDYSLLPDPQDMIFVCVGNRFLETDVPVLTENGSTLIPMRALLEAVGAEVEWNGAARTVTAKLNQTVVRMTVDNPKAVVNGAEVAMPVPVRSIQGRVYIPLRFVSEQLGLPVIWQPNNRIVKVFGHPGLEVEWIPSSVAVDTDDFAYGNFFSIATRFLLRQNGEIHWLEKWGDQLFIRIFDESFRKKGEAVLRPELPLFGGAHAGDDGNFYLVFGQSNAEESDTKPVYRIVKYDQRWNRIAHVDVSDVFVTIPFHASNLSMASKDGVLVVYSARERYLTPDGKHHQSNIPIHIRMDDMTVLYKGGEFPRNHVSHSFANYVKFDGDRIVYLDHGDAYPRSIHLQVEEAERIIRKIDILTFPGEIGDNYTGATVGGLEVSESHYLAVGTYHGRLFLAAVPKHAGTDENVDFAYLTGPSESSVGETHLVKLSDDRFVILWSDSSSSHNVSYAVVDGSGKMIGKPKKLDGVASPGNMDPLVLDGKIIWYYREIVYNQEDLAEFYKLEADR